MASRPAVLWAEDNLQDQMLIRAALQGSEEASLAQAIEFADDGLLLLERLEVLRDQAQLPALVVLDLKMPRMGGLDALRRIRSDARLTSVPVSVFTSGDRADERLACLDLGAAAVVRKPIDFRELSAAVRQLVSCAMPTQ